MSRLANLRELDIADNGLGILPEPVFELPDLEHLDVSGEHLGRRLRVGGAPHSSYCVPV